MSPWLIGGGVLMSLVVLSDAAIVARPPVPEPVPEDKNLEVPPDSWFTQYLDHFNITDNREWKQRYHVITKYFKKGGPAFVLLGGEWEVTGDSLLKYAITAYARKFNALLFQLEHRFYGFSHPTSDVSTENLHYLSADQALVDTAYFIKGMNEKHELPPSTKWVVFGGSYAANLAAWMRDKYSHLVYAAVADSGPILAKVNFYEYMNVVKETLARATPDCVTAVQEAHRKFKELLHTSEGQRVINKKFKLCDPLDLTDKYDKFSLLACLADNFGGLVQYNGSTSTTVDKVCNIMLNASVADIIDRYAEFHNLEVSEAGDECLDYKYKKGVEEMKNISWEAKKVISSARQWAYQSCTEFGFYQTSVKQDQLFFEDVPLYLPLQQCKDIFGELFNKDLIYKGKNRTNIVYGGLDGQATRVAYIYSEGDPWHALGNSETKVAESPVIYIKGASHCAVYSQLKDSDSPAVQKAWHQVEDLVEKWCTEE